MNPLDIGKDKKTIDNLVSLISGYNGSNIRIMEVCGSHTMAIGKYGIRNILPENVSLISGPGCPVCVTEPSFIDTAFDIAEKRDIIICTFGDMIKVKGHFHSLRDICNLKVVVSPIDCLKICKDNPSKEIVFLSIGFETTTPVIALSVLKAKEENIHNFSVITANKTMPHILNYLAKDPDINIDGFIFPGHVCAVSGCGFYENFCIQNNVRGVVTGFEPTDILSSILYILNAKIPYFYNNYSRFVKESGNISAKEITYKIFQESGAYIHGMGYIEGAGLTLRDEFIDFDAEIKFNTPVVHTEIKNKSGCICEDVIKGKQSPDMCPNFGVICNPEDPKGACMVSEEGACAAMYKYNNRGNI